MRKLRIAAAILAGGRGERLGGINKALLEIGGRRMIDRVIEAVGAADPILLCAGPNAFTADSRVHIIADLPTAYAGPLAGVASAVAALDSGTRPDMLLTVAVDTPFFPGDFAERATALLADDDELVVATYGSQDYPTNALWHFGSIVTLPAELAAGTAPHSLKRLIGTRRSQRLDYARYGSSNPFENANSSDDLEALRNRAEPRKRG